MSNKQIDVSVVVPVHNAEEWLEECLQSVLDQDFTGTMELSAYNDASTDGSQEILDAFSDRLNERDILCTLSGGMGKPGGVGYAKNNAVKQSHGEYLCFLDADDVMMKSRVSEQYEVCQHKEDVIVGCQFHRYPPDSTPRYTHWANNLTQEQLHKQVYTSFGPTVVMPTWFCHRKVYDKVGGFDETGKGTPEDLIFFYGHLRAGGQVLRVDRDLLLYRYHAAAATFSITEDTLWRLRLGELERHMLGGWSQFSIWNGGKQGRKLYRSLSEESRKKVQAFCDVDVKKLAKGVYIYEESPLIPKPRVPIVRFNEAKPPFVMCVKLGMTKGEFESNLASLNLTEGEDYVHFS
ncbi:hypothetical protein JTE90_003743 [Oedothorax gibbosus]|uniref:Glycosyltransferase 2-like domain-containing protein n=1 Tax=Oedothorax gibbosus TaxID=931172 RepID=A0AAV6VBW6_9ARAC|nr:hypothetical protein JTE90_003743 [Oedothorax gibbosus]